MKVDLDELERKARADVEILDGLHGDPFKRGGWIGQRYHARNVVALIARIRELEWFIRATPESALQADKVHRDDFPELFTEQDGSALYMDEAAGRILEKGATIP